MTNIAYNRLALGNVSDLTTPTSTQKYPLGSIITTEAGLGDGGSIASSTYMYVYAGVALTAYVPYVINTGTTAATIFSVKAPVTSTTVGNCVCVPQVAFTVNYYGWVLIEGAGKGFMAAITYTLGDRLALTSAATSFTLNGTSGSSTLDAASAAVCLSSGSTNAAVSIVLLGRQNSIAAS